MNNLENLPPPPPLERQVTQDFGTNEIRVPFFRVREDYDNWIANNRIATEDTDSDSEGEYEMEDVPDSESDSDEEEEEEEEEDDAMDVVPVNDA
jgi:hypothetical protein